MEGVSFCAEQAGYLLKPNPAIQGRDVAIDLAAEAAKREKQLALIQAFWGVLKQAFSIHDAK